MRFVLDTNVISELRKPASRIDRNVVAWVRRQDEFALFVPAMVIFELELGVRRIERRDPHQGQHLRFWLDEVTDSFRGRILAVDQDVARRAAELQVPDPRSDHDCFIAATALVHGMAVATRNVKDFRSFEVSLVDPWTS